MVKHLQVNWEDESSTDFETETSEAAQEFALLLASSRDIPQQKRFKVGDKVLATIVSLSDDSDDVLLSLGNGKESAAMSKRELLNSEGSLDKKTGEIIEAFIVAIQGGEILLSQSLSAQFARQHALDTAYGSSLPVKGKITSVNKGGFSVAVLGKSGFCPVSQLEKGFIAQPADYIGKEYDFIITQFSGRNIVLSRTSLIRAQEAKRLIELKQAAETQQSVWAHVKEIKPFGAFVDLDGALGMLHISEISYTRLGTVEEGLQLGEKLLVKVLSVDDSKPEHPRIAVSAKAVGGDPWDRVLEDFKVGTTYPGKVTRVAKFGAFVEVSPGIEGLAHISELSWLKRVQRPEEVLNAGDKVSVRILEVSPTERKMSLSMKSLDQDPWLEADTWLTPGSVHTAKVEDLRPYGAIMILKEGVTGLIPAGILKQVFGAAYRKKASPGETLEVKIAQVDPQARRVALTMAHVTQDEESAADFKAYLLQHAAAQKPADLQAKGPMGSFGALLSAQIKSKT